MQPCQHSAFESEIAITPYCLVVAAQQVNGLHLPPWMEAGGLGAKGRFQEGVSNLDLAPL